MNVAFSNQIGTGGRTEKKSLTLCVCVCYVCICTCTCMCVCYLFSPFSEDSYPKLTCFNVAAFSPPPIFVFHRALKNIKHYFYFPILWLNEVSRFAFCCPRDPSFSVWTHLWTHLGIPVDGKKLNKGNSQEGLEMIADPPRRDRELVPHSQSREEASPDLSSLSPSFCCFSIWRLDQSVPCKSLFSCYRWARRFMQNYYQLPASPYLGTEKNITVAGYSDYIVQLNDAE